MSTEPYVNKIIRKTWPPGKNRECSCECWRCKGGGHCVRCNAVINTGTKKH